MDKNQARLLVKSAIGDLSNAEKQQYSDKISDLILPYLGNTKSVFIYLAKNGEVDTLPIIKRLLERGVKVFTPKIVGDDMLLTSFDFNKKIVKNKFGISEVTADGEKFYEADINIIPIVAFDSARNRCGHGKGYYDKYLAHVTGKIFALAFSAQKVDAIDCQPHDVKPQLIFTEKGLIK